MESHLLSQDRCLLAAASGNLIDPENYLAAKEILSAQRGHAPELAEALILQQGLKAFPAGLHGKLAKRAETA